MCNLGAETTGRTEHHLLMLLISRSRLCLGSHVTKFSNCYVVGCSSTSCYLTLEDSDSLSTLPTLLFRSPESGLEK